MLRSCVRRGPRECVRATVGAQRLLGSVARSESVDDAVGDRVVRRPSKDPLLWETAEKVDFVGPDPIDAKSRRRCGRSAGLRALVEAKSLAVKRASQSGPGLFQRSR